MSLHRAPGRPKYIGYHLLVGAALLAVVVSACSDSQPVSEAVSTFQGTCDDLDYARTFPDLCVPSDGVEPVDVPAGESALTPWGLELTVIGVEVQTVDPQQAWGGMDGWTGGDTAENQHDRAVYVTTRYANPGSEAVTLEDPVTGEGLQGRLHYGGDLYEAESWEVDQLDDGRRAEALPLQLEPGSVVAQVELFSLPASGVEQLDYQVLDTLGQETIMWFSDLQNLVE